MTMPAKKNLWYGCMRTSDLIDDEEAVKEVCRIGTSIEHGLNEAERELRRWRSMPNGGHDPEMLDVQGTPDMVRNVLLALLSSRKPADEANSGRTEEATK